MIAELKDGTLIFRFDGKRSTTHKSTRIPASLQFRVQQHMDRMSADTAGTLWGLKKLWGPSSTPAYAGEAPSADSPGEASLTTGEPDSTASNPGQADSVKFKLEKKRERSAAINAALAVKLAAQAARRVIII